MSKFNISNQLVLSIERPNVIIKIGDVVLAEGKRFKVKAVTLSRNPKVDNIALWVDKIE